MVSWGALPNARSINAEVTGVYFPPAKCNAALFSATAASPSADNAVSIILLPAIKVKSLPAVT
ncbi:hypothetical protein Ppb6_00848 [Photorhabdus australis subsp. thailandensis]|uniref:Uncharacterized protein n=1 Tax=Photorhabdus australis subsp. thailandensis TaxID=2805096 RepID=A0A1C0U7D9_9GAMM|nr:hypothetical protein Ppb6_00848 [Photorhabdus australis subsp. thailandensis]